MVNELICKKFEDGGYVTKLIKKGYRGNRKS
jgi:hypothetical protein